MQYSLLHSSSIAQHFSCYRIKLFLLEIKVVPFKSFFQSKKQNGRHFKVINVTLFKFIF